MGRYVCRGTTGILDSESVVEIRLEQRAQVPATRR
jgi:hypothetical protein